MKLTDQALCRGIADSIDKIVEALEIVSDASVHTDVKAEAIQKLRDDATDWRNLSEEVHPQG